MIKFMTAYTLTVIAVGEWSDSITHYIGQSGLWDLTNDKREFNENGKLICTTSWGADAVVSNKTPEDICKNITNELCKVPKFRGVTVYYKLELLDSPNSLYSHVIGE